MLSVKQALKVFSKSIVVQKLKQFKANAFSEKYLLLTNLTISLSLSSTGDILEQKYERYSGRLKKWDQKRTLNMAVSGVSVGFICHYWYKFLDKRMPGTNIVIVLKKVVLDQLICSPVYISIFFLTLGFLDNNTWEETFNEMKSKAWKLYAAEWMIWPVAQVVNFYYLPNRYRILYDNIISLGYDVYTSNIKYCEDDTEDESQNVIEEIKDDLDP